MGDLRRRIELVERGRDWLAEMSNKHHYIHKGVHPRASPFGWGIRFDGKELMPDNSPSGFIVFSSIHFTKMVGEFGYEGLPTKWQVLCLSRLWLHDDLPRNSETCVIAKALKLVQRRWIEVHPPRYPDEPYHIRKVISYADGSLHVGTIYRAANFRELAPVVTKARKMGPRGIGVDGGTKLYRFVYDLAEPRWAYQAPQPTLFSLIEGKEHA